MGFEPQQLHSWQANVLCPLHIEDATQMEISVDQYAVLHQHYDSVQAAFSMSLQCELVKQYICLQCLNSIVAALLQCPVTRDGETKRH